MQSVKNIHVIFGLLLVLFSSAALAKHLSEVQTTAQPGTVSLTFDDGPSPIYTPQILDILKKMTSKPLFLW
jgi:peptidoglycan/xylan/chitin deacetylase (PgdA/CDA1 family)